ncbi:uroporphyrinogen-III synthase-like [Anneissia japonica]|uniref:uroporphyrinogen-III synthase-like n=1 Tax=Anneissia japonica TaxID=1529436 RepID=UPI0014259CF9|nr:uroporphyrinogen-III synthase-like [Anneissia japonica]
MKKKVVLLKAAKGKIEDDLYLKVLRSEGLLVTLIQVLSFKFFNLKELYEQIAQPEKYGGIIFSSPRAVEAVNKSIENNSSLKEWQANLIPKWHSLPAYTVGQASGEFVKELGLIPIGADSGNAENLVKTIKTGYAPSGRPLLFPCGNLRRETIPQSLDDEGISFESVTVYETTAHPEIDESFRNLIKNEGVPDYIVFFSPSGVRFSCEAISSLIPAMDEIQFIAIGPTTKEAMEKSGYTVTATAESPSPGSLLKILI